MFVGVHREREIGKMVITLGLRFRLVGLGAVLPIITITKMLVYRPTMLLRTNASSFTSPRTVK